MRLSKKNEKGKVLLCHDPFPFEVGVSFMLYSLSLSHLSFLFLWEGQQELLDLQVPLVLPLRLAGKVGEVVLDLLQNLV